MAYNMASATGSTNHPSSPATHVHSPSSESTSLGFGVGKIAHAVFNYFTSSWQTPPPPHKKNIPLAQPKRSIEQAGPFFPAAFDLATLDGTNGFKVEGLSAGDQLGCSVRTAGDLNGDGKADLVLGAYGADPGGRTGAGTVYVLFGQTSGWPASFNLTTLNGTNGFKVEGLSTNDWLGYSVSSAGDLNGDGKSDLLMGAYVAFSNGSSYAGTAYVLLGQASGWPAVFKITTLDGTNGFKVEGLSAYDQLGYSVSTAGDLNGDGKADLVLGADGAAPGARTNGGTAYVLFGQASGWPAAFNLTILNGTNGFKVEGLSANDWLGYSVSTAGDMNGDGKADLVLGAYTAAGVRGTAYVLFGQASGWPAAFNLTILNGTNGFKVEGLSAGDQLGSCVSTAGDLNGDGKADLVLGAAGADPGTNAGTAYVLFGQASGWPAAFNLTILNGTNGFKVEGLKTDGSLGQFQSVRSAGDLNGDGKADLVLGAYGADPSGLGVLRSAGTVYVLFGQASGWPADFNLATLNGANGFKVEGLSADDYLGWAVSTAGDLDGDGKADLVLGAPNAAGGRGKAYVIFGGNATDIPFSPSATPTSISAPTLDPTPASFSTSVATPDGGLVNQSPQGPSIPAIAGGAAGGVVAIAIIGTVVFLRVKRKGCFADDAQSRGRSDSVHSVKLKAYS